MMAATPSLACLLSFDRAACKSRPVEPSSVGASQPDGRLILDDAE